MLMQGFIIASPMLRNLSKPWLPRARLSRQTAEWLGGTAAFAAHGMKSLNSCFSNMIVAFTVLIGTSFGRPEILASPWIYGAPLELRIQAQKIAHDRLWRTLELYSLVLYLFL